MLKKSCPCHSERSQESACSPTMLKESRFLGSARTADPRNDRAGRFFSTLLSEDHHPNGFSPLKTVRTTSAVRLSALSREAISNAASGWANSGGGVLGTYRAPMAIGPAQATHSGSIEKSTTAIDAEEKRSQDQTFYRKEAFLWLSFHHVLVIPSLDPLPEYLTPTRFREISGRRMLGS